jgi:hypothetical protein
MSGCGSTPITVAAGGISARLAAPTPHPTSSTDPPAGTAARARRSDGLSPVLASSAAAAIRAKRPTSNRCGSRGAAARSSSGIAHAMSSSAHRSPALPRLTAALQAA